MKRFFATLAFAAASAATCMAQCQGNHLTVSQEMHGDGSTLVGTVEAAQDVADSSFHLDGINYIVHVDRVIKGKLIETDVVKLFSENSPAKFPMQVGKQYLLFVHLNYNTLEVDNCGNSGLLEADNIQNVKQVREYARR